MTFDSDIRRLRLASYVAAGVAATVGLSLLFHGMYLSAALCGVLCLCNALGLGTLKAQQKTRDLCREIGRIKSKVPWITTISKN